MKKIIPALFVLYVLVVGKTFAQMPNMGNMSLGKGTKIPQIAKIYGKIVDSKTKKPIEYATVSILWFSKDSVIAGTITKPNGDFSIENLSFGGFKLRINYLGYTKYEEKLYITPQGIEKDLGNLELTQDATQLKTVEVSAEKSTLELAIDRKIYNVDKDLSAKGGTGIDAVKNVPGVSVDADNNVTLRNQAVMILIDNRPTTLTLQQIPSDQIDRIEVITNPSVKYDASTTGGILNVILKKNNKPGYNGILMTSIGTGNRFLGLANINVKEGRFNFFSFYTFNFGSNTTSGYTNRINTVPLFGLSSFEQWNNTLVGNMFHFARGGFDFNLNNRNSITVSGNYISGNFNSNDKSIFGIYDTLDATVLEGNRIADQKAGFKNYTGQLAYKRTYPKAGKEFAVDAMYNFTDAAGGYNFTTNNYFGGALQPNNPQIQKNINLSKAHMVNGQIDYVNPISEIKKIEWGLKSNYQTSVSNNGSSNYDYVSAAYTEDTTLTNNYQINNLVNAAYINYTSKIKKIGYVAGLRFEQSYYQGVILNKNEQFGYNYPTDKNNFINALFPAIYLSHKFKGQELQANFSRKIDRPNFFQLMPYIMFSDKTNLRRGNPELKPEFINMAEINYNVKINKLDVLTSVYGKYIEQPITNVAYPLTNNPNVLLNTYQNGNNSYNLGWENTFKFTIWKSFSVMSNTNIYYKTINYTNNSNQIIANSGYNWMTKLNVSYTLPWDLKIQLNGTYESPQIIPQGKTIPLYFMDISLNKMINLKYIFNLSLSDVLNTKKMGTMYVTPDYTQTLNRRRETRYLKFSFTWLFGKFDTSIFKRRPKAGDPSMNMGGSGQDGLDFGK